MGIDKFYHPERATYIGKFRLLVEFENGELKIVDFNSWLKRDLKSYNDLKNEEIFKKFYIEDGIITWNNGYDISPEFVYENGKPIIFHLENNYSKQIEV